MPYRIVIQALGAGGTFKDPELHASREVAELLAQAEYGNWPGLYRIEIEEVPEPSRR